MLCLGKICRAGKAVARIRQQKRTAVLRQFLIFFASIRRKDIEFYNKILFVFLDYNIEYYAYRKGNNAYYRTNKRKDKRRETRHLVYIDKFYQNGYKKRKRNYDKKCRYGAEEHHGTVFLKHYGNGF